jgi:hypothetical protein
LFQSPFKDSSDDYGPTKRSKPSSFNDDDEDHEGADILRKLKEQQTKFRDPIARVKKTKFSPSVATAFSSDEGISGTSSTIYGTSNKYLPEKPKFEDPPKKYSSKPYKPNYSNKYNVELSKFSPESSNYEPITTKFSVAHPPGNAVSGSSKFKPVQEEGFETRRPASSSYKGKKPDPFEGNEASYEGTRYRKPTEFKSDEKSPGYVEYGSPSTKQQDVYTLEEFNAKFGGKFSPPTQFANFQPSSSNFQPSYGVADKFVPVGSSIVAGPKPGKGPKFSNIGKVITPFSAQINNDFPASSSQDITKYRSEFGLKNIHLADNISNGKGTFTNSQSSHKLPSEFVNPYDFKPSFKLQDVPNLYPSESYGQSSASRGQIQNYLRAEHRIKDEILKQNLLNNPNPAARGQLQQFYKAKEDERIEQEVVLEQLKNQQLGPARPQSFGGQRPKGPRPGSLQTSQSKFYPVRKQPVRAIRPYRSPGGVSTIRFSF